MYSNEQELLEINALIQDPKQQSENVMIVDLLRNDLGKIAHTGSVHVDKMLMVEKYKTIYQIISKITCKVDKDIPLHKLIDALFPCGSITGAPKLSTCAIIKDVEKTQRGVYTGAIGYITPENNMCFSVQSVHSSFMTITNSHSALVGASYMNQTYGKNFSNVIIRHVFY